MKLSTASWYAQGAMRRLLGHDMFCIDTAEPNKPAMLLIHGFPTSSWDWVPIWDQLAETHRLVTLDLLGFGFSAKPNPHTYSIMEQADLCEALVAELGLSEMHVLAHDYGDTVAQELLARQNAAVGAGRWLSLCLLNGGLFPETHQARFVQKLLLSPLGPVVSRLITKRTFDKSFSAVFGPHTQPSPDELDGFWSLISHNDGNIMHRLITYMRDRKQHRERWVGALQHTAIPVALINGSADPVSGAHMVERYREIVSTERFIVELPTIGHYPQVEAPNDMLAAYRTFLGGL